MRFDTRQRVYKLKAVRETDLFAIRAAPTQSSVIIAATVTKTVTGPVKHDPRDNDQIQYSQRQPIALRRFRNTERARGQIFKAGDLEELESLPGYAWISNPLTSLEGATGDHLCQHFIVNGAVQGQKFHISKQARPEKSPLNLPAKFATLVLRKRFTFSQKLCPDCSFRHEQRPRDSRPPDGRMDRSDRR